MKRLLKGVIDFGKLGQESLAYNYQRLKNANVQWTHPADEKVYRFVSDFFASELNLPNARVLVDYFTKLDDHEVLERLKDIKGAANYEGANYNFVLREVVESQNKIRFMTLLKEAGEVAKSGLVVGEGRDKERLEGVAAAVSYLQGRVNDLLQQDANAKTRGEIRDAALEAKQEYQVAKANPSNAWGALCGIETIDEACHGLKRGEMWVHAAFTGELKCLPGDAWVYDHASNRRVTIREMSQQDKGALPIVTALYREGLEHKLVKAQVSRMESNGVRPVFDLKLGSGRTVGATGNHPFYTLEGWKALEGIKEGDWVAVPKKSHRSPVRAFSDAEVTLVGYLLGDGTLGLGGNFGVTAHHPEIREDIIRLLEALGYQEGSSRGPHPCYRIYDGVEIRLSSNPGTSKFHKSARSPLRLLAERLGIWGKDSHGKVIPGDFYGLPESQVALVLGALWSTDGSCHTGDHAREDRDSLSCRNDITYSSVSHQLCLGIQSLLLQLGIQSSVTRVNTTYKEEPYTFSTVRVVTRESKRKFVQKIRVVGKESRFQDLLRRLPAEDDQPWQGLAQKFAELPESEDLRSFMEGDLHWEPVVSVAYRGDEETWDIEVPEHHSFVVNDIVSHNTTFALTWCYNLITRYRRNVFYASLEMPFKQVRRLICCLHSSHPKWALQGKKPLDYRKIRDGELSEEEEDFYFEVLDDFFTNDDYARMELWCPDHDITVAEVKLEAELLHKQMDVGFCVVDHGGILTDPRKSGRGTGEELNAVVRDCKKMALHFNQGEGLPVLLLFQLNRQGKDEAMKNQGRYKLSALSYANECLAEGTLVRTNHGVRPIEEVDSSMRVWSSSGWKPVLRKMNNGPKAVVEVRTAQGFTVTSTPDHLFRTFGARGLEWTEARDLKGKYVVADTDYTLEDQRVVLPPLTIDKYEKSKGEQGYSLKVPGVMGSDLAYLLGAHDGDGVAGNAYKVGWTGNKNETSVLACLQEKFERIFGHHLPVQFPPSRPGSFDCSKWSKPLSRWFELVGANRHPVVSPYILRAGPTAQASYLKGLWDADGSINSQGSLSLSASGAKKGLIQQVHLLMWGLGIPCSLKEGFTVLNGRQYPRATLTISSVEGRLAFLQTVGGFTEPWKAQRLSDFCKVSTKNRTKWPVGEAYLRVWDRYLSKKTAPVRSCLAAARKIRKGGVLVNESALIALVSTLGTVTGDKDLDYLRLVLKTKPQLVENVTPQPCEVTVYDIEVTGDHEYSAGGLLTHNCERSADYVTTTYLDDNLRESGRTIFCNLKNRDNPHFPVFEAGVDFTCRRIYNLDPGEAMTADVNADEMDELLENV